MKLDGKVFNPKNAAMSFDEIGRELGITSGGAWMAYKSGMNKLRQTYRRRQLATAHELAKSKTG